MDSAQNAEVRGLWATVAFFFFSFLKVEMVVLFFTLKFSLQFLLKKIGSSGHISPINISGWSQCLSL